MELTAQISSIPRHIAIIMDGNGRWAKRRNLPRAAGHKAGMEALKRTVEYAARINVNALTVYAFSSENRQRSTEEISLLIELFILALKSEVGDLDKNNVRLRFIGDQVYFPKELQALIHQAEQQTKKNDGLLLNVAANYGGRWDIIQACRALLDAVYTRSLSIDALNEEALQNKLALADCPEPELLIRSGGEQRISNYLLWQLAYAELYFTDTLWPDFNAAALDLSLTWFSKRQRRFGKVLP